MKNTTIRRSSHLTILFLLMLLFFALVLSEYMKTTPAKAEESAIVTVTESTDQNNPGECPMPDRIIKTDEEWRAVLTPEQYRILRESGTEMAFTGRYVKVDEDGIFRCAACGNPLFSSETKFDSGSGWPSFWKPISDHAVKLIPDHSHGMNRTEVRCARCDGHLGHVFDDGPQPTGERFCINSSALQLDTESTPEPND